MPPSSPEMPAAKWIAVVLIVISGIAFIWVVSRPQPKTAHAQPAAAKPAPGANSTLAAASAAASPMAAAPAIGTAAAAKAPPVFPSFQARPLAVTQESANYQWTAEDGKSPEVIRRLAHNEMEEKRMLAENPRIKRRQLVYIKQPVAALVEQSKLTGQKVQSLVLPGLDGEELPFEITSAALEPSGQIGTFTGHLAGRPQSTVSLAYRFGRQAFTILSPEDGSNFDAESREPGQVIVKSIDPDVYSPLPDKVILSKSPPEKGP